MRIAQVSLVSTPTRKSGSDSIEYLVWQLSEELIRQGHEVTVFGAAGSETSGELVVTSQGPRYGEDGALDDWELAEWVSLCRAVQEAKRFDVIHEHAYLWGVPLDPVSPTPIVHTMHIQPYDDHFRIWDLYPDACVTGISRYQWREYTARQPAAFIHHGVDPDLFQPTTQAGDYVAYMGRFTDGKGPLLAIETARALGLRLVLGGPDDEYYRERLAPFVDGKNVEFAGYLGASGKNRVLGGARAFLYPMREAEPFGLVQIEAMMCGTPVAAIGIGAVPEIVEEGVTGAMSPGPEGFAAAVTRAMALDRRAVRERAVERFSTARMARDYVQVYEQLLARRGRS